MISAPSEVGFYNTGDMKVLSTQSRAPTSLHNLATPAMSVHFKVGLVGLSIQTIFVFDLIFFLTALKSHMSVYSNSIPV